MQTGIPFFKSKTFWLNVIAGILTLAGMLTAPDNPFHFGAKSLAIIGTVVAALNIILRLFSTSQPIQGTNSKATG